jgi:hypothetical protein
MAGRGRNALADDTSLIIAQLVAEQLSCRSFITTNRNWSPARSASVRPKVGLSAKGARSVLPRRPVHRLRLC